MPTRRTLLRTLAAASTATAGCGSPTDDSRRTLTATSTEPGTPTVSDAFPPVQDLTGWSTFRGDPAHTGRAGDSSGPATPADIGVDWHIKLAQTYRAKRLSAADGVLFVTGGAREVCLVDAETGTGVRRTYSRGDHPGPIITEIVTDGGVAAGGTGDGSGTVFAVDPYTGQQHWIDAAPSVEYEGTVRRWAVRATPTIHDGTVVYAVPHYETLDAAGPHPGAIGARDVSGEPQWPDVGKPWTNTKRIQDHVRASPVVRDGTVYVKTIYESALYALDFDDGSLVWRTPLGSQSASEKSDRSPAIGASTVYVVGTDRTLQAIDRASGEILWTFPGTDSGPPMVESILDPVLMAEHGKVVIPGSDIIYGLSTEDGAVAWTATPDSDVIYWTRPAVDPTTRTVYVAGHPAVRTDSGTRDNSTAWLFAIDARDGTVLASVRGSGPASAPVITDGAVFVTFGKDLYRVD